MLSQRLKTKETLESEFWYAYASLLDLTIKQDQLSPRQREQLRSWQRLYHYNLAAIRRFLRVLDRGAVTRRELQDSIIHLSRLHSSLQRRLATPA